MTSTSLGYKMLLNCQPCKNCKAIVSGTRFKLYAESKRLKLELLRCFDCQEIYENSPEYQALLDLKNKQFHDSLNRYKNV